jgi:hypothetical protein
LRATTVATGDEDVLINVWPMRAPASPRGSFQHTCPNSRNAVRQMANSKIAAEAGTLNEHAVSERVSSYRG